MTKKTRRIIRKYNHVLIKYDQSNTIISWSNHDISVTFANGFVLKGKEREKFRSRLKNKWYPSFHDIATSLDIGVRMLFDIELKKHKRINAQKGARAFWEDPKKVEEYKKKRKGSIPWNKGLRGVQKYKPMSEQARHKLSEERMGSGNPMFGMEHSLEYRQNKSNLMKKKILNGDFTPKTNNRNTHWESIFDGKKYRSSWECFFHYHNPNLEYETLRIPYSIDGVSHIYIVDFLDIKNKIAYEIKPSTLIKTSIEKIKAANIWCKENEFKFYVVTEKTLSKLEPILEADEIRFDNRTLQKIKKVVS